MPDGAMADGDETTHDVTLPADPVIWPDGRQAAAFLGFDMDAEDVALRRPTLDEVFLELTR